MGVVLMGASARAAIINVPADCATIQAAINAATDDDEIVVQPGTYVERIDFLGKAITVRGAPANPAFTILDGGAAGSVVTFNTAEGPASELAGLTITNGTGTANGDWGTCGGGVFCGGASSPTISNCTISGNTAAAGGGI